MRVARAAIKKNGNNDRLVTPIGPCLESQTRERGPYYDEGSPSRLMPPTRLSENDLRVLARAVTSRCPAYSHSEGLIPPQSHGRLKGISPCDLDRSWLLLLLLLFGIFVLSFALFINREYFVMDWKEVDFLWTANIGFWFWIFLL